MLAHTAEKKEEALTYVVFLGQDYTFSYIMVDDFNVIAFPGGMEGHITEINTTQ